jgi:RHS repeat-associated protein
VRSCPQTQNFSESGPPAQNNYKFEGKERDTETGNDDFGARYYTWRFGRWLSADWSNVPVPVPYANLTNPQTLNLYAMVSDDPESFADLDGHQEAEPEREREEDDKEDKEFEEAVNRVREKEDAQEARQVFGAHAAWVRTQPNGYVDPLTGICYAPDPKAGEPTMRSSGPEPPQLAEGKEAHKNEPVRSGEKPEVRTPSGKRMDRYNESEAHIREIKPNNPRQTKAGRKQLEGYKKEMDAAKKRDHTTELTLYNKNRPGPKPRPPKPDE